MPRSVRVLLESVKPVALELIWDGPAQLAVAKDHAHKVALLMRPFPVNKAFPAVEDHKVVDEVHVSGLGLDFELRGLRDGLDGIQGLDLAR